MKRQIIIEKSKTWVERFVIGLNLCPFAKRPFDKGLVRFEVCESEEMESQLVAFWKEIELLENTNQEEISNTILILPNGLEDFENYLDFYHLAEQLLTDQRKQTAFQLASFHPRYQFENTQKDDLSNYTNRSPFPFIHILRIAEVANAIAHYPDVEGVPERNIQRLNEMGLEEILKLRRD